MIGHQKQNILLELIKVFCNKIKWIRVKLFNEMHSLNWKSFYKDSNFLQSSNFWLLKIEHEYETNNPRVSIYLLFYKTSLGSSANRLLTIKVDNIENKITSSTVGTIEY